MSSTIEIFCCYAHKDQSFLFEIQKHLIPLQRQGFIRIWSDIDINAGIKWQEAIKEHLDTAQIILLLVSADFIHSDYCYSIEMKRAIERHEQKDAYVIPIVCRSTLWETTLGKLQALPTNAHPIAKWEHPDDAYVDVAKGIRNVVEKLMIQLHSRKIALFGYETQGGSISALWNNPSTFSLNETTYQNWLETKRDFAEGEIIDRTWVRVGDHGNSFVIRFMRGGSLFESSLGDPDKEQQGSWMFVDGMLRANINYSEICELHILASRDGSMCSGIEYKNGMKGTSAYFILLLPLGNSNIKHDARKMIQDTKPYDNALNGYNRISDLNPHSEIAYRTKGDILRDLKLYEEALAAYQRSIELSPSTQQWRSKGVVLYKVHRYEESLEAFEQVTKLDGSNAKVYEKGHVLHELWNIKEVLSTLVTAELLLQGERLITEEDVIVFLSQLACMARSHKRCNAIQLGRAGVANERAIPRLMPIPELAARLQLWLDEYALPETDRTGQDVQHSQIQKVYTPQEIEQLALLSQSAGLIDISDYGVLSFKHALIADYLSANYLHVIDINPQVAVPFGNELVADIGAWSKPMAMWAGMSSDPMELAKRVANLSQSYPQYSYNALSLSIICAGARWGPQETTPAPLPENVSQLLVTAVHDVDQRTQLAKRLKRSADEGGIGVYRALLPLIMEAHIDDLLLMLEKHPVSNLLFDHLRDAIETSMPSVHVKQLVHTLVRFGEVAVPQAVKLSQSGPTNNIDMRIEALHVLGETNVLQVVEPLVGNLSDPDDRIINATVNALIQLGPTLALDAVLEKLKSPYTQAPVPRSHRAALAVLQSFLSHDTLNYIQCKRTAEALLQAISSLYIPDIQGEAIRGQVDQHERRIHQLEQDSQIIQELCKNQIAMQYDQMTRKN